MSDFLNRLVTRTFKPEAAIQPRLPSLFESPTTLGDVAGLSEVMSPLTASDDPLDGPPDERSSLVGINSSAAVTGLRENDSFQASLTDSTGALPSSISTEDQGPERPTAPSRLASVSGSEEQRRHSGAIRQKPASEEKARTRSQRRSAHPAEPHAERLEAASLPAVAIRAAPNDEALLSTKLPAVRASERIVRPGTPNADASKPIASSSAFKSKTSDAARFSAETNPNPTARTNSAGEAAGLLGKSLGTQSASPEIPRMPAALMSALANANAFRPAATASAPARKEAPTIHVTIGRVEVRAVSAPPAPQRRPRPGPRLSLEAYRKQRQRPDA
ncbi:MAG: hypothetical protein L0Z50_02265 [Verrucomicrobiales bacterium]|nr:hypothetical protein [Verrucomicrobiales bacterium]